MLQTLSTHQPTISAFTKKFFAEQKQKFADHFWTEDYFTRLEKYMLGGKIIRGSLIIALYEIFAKKEKSPPSSTHQLPVTNYQTPLAVIKTATAMELMQAALLMHDDILDQDELRRGSPAMHTQYKNLVEKERISQPARNSLPHSQNSHPKHFGTGMAICGGDIAFGLCFSLLVDLDVGVEIKTRLQALFSQELVCVALAEMNDFEMATTTRSLTKQDIIKMYRYKTGRYSLALPMMVGAILAGETTTVSNNSSPTTSTRSTHTTLKTLEKIGENLGIIFQIKDDELGIWGDEKKTGKPSGNDIREGKKTLFWYYLNEYGGQEYEVFDVENGYGSLGVGNKLEKIKQALGFFGEQNLTEENIEIVRETIKKSGVLEKVNDDVGKLADLVALELKSLDISDLGKEFFDNFLEFSKNRNK